jgi:hypothetical protein
MCKFFSAIVSRSGELYFNKLTTSHEDIIDEFLLKDNSLVENICRVEFYPNKKKDVFYPDKYKLHIDEQNIPDWFDIEKQEAVSNQLKDIITNMIISDTSKILIGGAYILLNAKVEKLQNCIVYFMSDTSSIGKMSGTSSIGEMYDTSSVGKMNDTSSVGEMSGTSSVGEMSDRSSVKTDNRKR